MSLDPRIPMMAQPADLSGSLMGGFKAGYGLADLGRKRAMEREQAARDQMADQERMSMDRERFQMDKTRFQGEQDQIAQQNAAAAFGMIARAAKSAQTPEQFGSMVDALGQSGIIKPEIAQKYRGAFDQRDAIAAWADTQAKNMPASYQEYEAAKNDPAYMDFLNQQRAAKQADAMALIDARRPERRPQTVTTAQGVFLQNEDGTLGQKLGDTPVAGKNNAYNMSPYEQKEFFEADDAVRAGGSAVSSLARALELNEKAYSGAAAGLRRDIARNTGIGSEERIKATTEFENLILGQALESLKAIFGGSPTEGERQILLDLQASINKSPEERAVILENAKKKAEQRIQSNMDKMNRLSTGSFFAPRTPTDNQPSLQPSTNKPNIPPPPPGSELIGE